MTITIFDSKIKSVCTHCNSESYLKVTKECFESLRVSQQEPHVSAVGKELSIKGICEYCYDDMAGE